MHTAFSITLLHRFGSPHVLRLVFGAFALAATCSARAYITVGPSGSYNTIQLGVAAAIAAGGGEVRVQVKVCTDPHGFQYICPYKENVSISTTTSVSLRGGWQSDFQTPYPGAIGTLVQGTATDAQVIAVVASGGGSVQVSGFEVSGQGITAGYNTRGITALAYTNSAVLINNNSIHNVSLLTDGRFYATAPGGGAGILTIASGTGATVTVNSNTITGNAVYGTNNGSSNGGGVLLQTIQVGHTYFDANTVTGNSVSNPSGGACHGGGLWAQADTGTLQLYGNTYMGNQQFACGNGATGDAADIDAINASAINISNETWTSNTAANDPGVYEVFMHAESSAHIFGGNGLVTHGTWGGLYAQSDADSTITLVNFTIADNPVLGYHGVGTGTQLWNTILWNDGSPYQLDNGATFAFCLFASNPLFIDSEGGNYRLSLGSPAINAGYDLVPTGQYAHDLDNSPRPYLGDGVGIADIGAYEFHAFERIFANGFDP